MPTVCGRTSMIPITGRAMYRLNNSLISRSDARSFGPVWYHPIMRSRAESSRRQRDCQGFRTDGGPKRLVRTVDLLEHFEHRFDVVVVKEPCLGILVVFLKRNTERVGYVD